MKVYFRWRLTVVLNLKVLNTRSPDWGSKLNYETISRLSTGKNVFYVICTHHFFLNLRFVVKTPVKLSKTVQKLLKENHNLLFFTLLLNTLKKQNHDRLQERCDSKPTSTASRTSDKNEQTVSSDQRPKKF